MRTVVRAWEVVYALASLLLKEPWGSWLLMGNISSDFWRGAETGGKIVLPPSPIHFLRWPPQISSLEIHSCQNPPRLGKETQKISSGLTQNTKNAGCHLASVVVSQTDYGFCLVQQTSTFPGNHWFLLCSRNLKYYVGKFFDVLYLALPLMPIFRKPFANLEWNFRVALC